MSATHKCVGRPVQCPVCNAGPDAPLPYDHLRPARGVFYGMASGLVLWGVIALVVWALWP